MTSPTSQFGRTGGVGILMALLLIGCSSLGADEAPDPVVPAESLAPPTGDETRYLGFQIFQGGPDPAIPFDNVLSYTPREKIAAVVHDIVTTIGTTGEGRSRLAFIVGPISFDHSDAEARQIIADAFAIARAENVAVGIHLDDSMFWSKRADLRGDPANIEWTDFDGSPATGLLLDWAHPPARMTFNAPAIRAEVQRRARDVIGAEIAAQVAILEANGQQDLFAGVIAGWESHMGQDVSTDDRVGFHALTNRGYGPDKPPQDVGAVMSSIVAEFIGLWTTGLAQAGVDPGRIYTHVAFLPEARFDQLDTPDGITYDMVVDAAPSTQRPATAFVANSRPGFTTYPTIGVFDQIHEELDRHGDPPWASSEGSPQIPGQTSGSTRMTMETYLARCFNHGATLVNVFGWGIGGTIAPDNPFRVAAEEPAALDAYRKFLNSAG